MLRAIGALFCFGLALATSGCGGGMSAVQPQQPQQPQSTAPIINSMLPTSATVGSPDITLTITGSNLTGSTHNIRRAVWSANGINTELATTPVSNTQLGAVIPARLMASSVTALVSLEYGDPMGDVALSTSNAISFSVTAPAPTATHGFSAIGSMVAARSGHSTTLLLSGKVLVVGGADRLGTLNSAELYDPTTDAFTVTGSLAAPRQGHSATLLADGKVLIAGGEDNVGPIGTAELYDPVAGTFRSIGSMNNARWSHTATLLTNGKVLVAGGANNTDSQDSAELFDPASTLFSAVGNMTSPRMHHTATRLPDGKVLLVGGWSTYSPTISSASAELFDPTTNNFSAVGAMSIPRFQHGSILLPDGRVLVVGGSEHLFSTSLAEIFDPASERFAVSGNLHSKRTSHTVTVLASGQVLVVGGIYVYSGPDAPESTVLATCELYSAASQGSTLTGPLASSRVGHTTTLLNDGRVLVIGGTDSTGNALATAEVYE